MCVETKLVRSWSRLGPSLCVLLTLSAMALFLGTPLCFLGKQWEDERQFLKNYRAPNDYETQIAYTMNYAQNSSEYNDVVFHGDSTCLINLRPKVFEQATGMKAYNLGSVGVIGFDGFVWVFRNYLEHHPRPKMLVLCIHPRALKEPALAFGHRQARESFVWSYGPGTEDRRPPHQSPIADYFRQGFWVAYGQLSGGVERYADEPVYNRQGKSYNSLAAEMVEERGYWEQPGSLEADWQPRKLVEEPFAMLPANKEQLFELARLTEQNGILLMIRIAPLVKGDGPRDSRGLRSWTAELEGSFRNVIVSRPEILHYDADCFSDIDHCNRKGADRFTAFVGEEVKKAFVGR